MLPQNCPAVEATKTTVNSTADKDINCQGDVIQQESDYSQKTYQIPRPNSTQQSGQSSLLGKRKAYQQEDCLLYCFQMMSVVNISFGDPVLDNYFEVVQNIFGEQNAQQILNRVSRQVNSRVSEKQVEENSSEQQMSQSNSKQILREIHRIIEKRLSIEIQRRVVALKTCIDACQKLALLESSQALIDFLHGNSFPDNEVGSLLQTIHKFIGTQTLQETIIHSLGKERAQQELNKNSEIPVPENISDDENFSTSSNNPEEDSANNNCQKYHHQNLVSFFKTSVLFQVMPHLSQLSQKLIYIKNFTLQCC